MNNICLIMQYQSYIVEQPGIKATVMHMQTLCRYCIYTLCMHSLDQSDHYAIIWVHLHASIGNRMANYAWCAFPFHHQISKQEAYNSFFTDQWASTESSEKPYTLRGYHTYKTPCTITIFPSSLSTENSNTTRNSIQFKGSLHLSTIWLQVAETICQTQLQKFLRNAIETPCSKLVTKPNIRMKPTRKWIILREIKETVESDMNAKAETIALKNRLS